MAQPYANEVTQYKTDFMRQAEELLLSGFPATILKLNALLATPKLKKRSFSDMTLNFDSVNAATNPPSENTSSSAAVLDNGDAGPPPVKKLRCDNKIVIIAKKLPAAILRANKLLTDLIETVKPYIVRFVEDAKAMRMWLTYMIPKIEDGNNFGVEIQEETLALVQFAENSASLFYERIFRYYSERAKIVKTLTKFPQVEDLQQSLQELDEKEYVHFCLDLVEIRNRYCTLYDVFMKNLDKIKKPRSAHPITSLY